VILLRGMLNNKLKNQKEKSKKYVVIRDGHRVSDVEYINMEDASTEYAYWGGLIRKWDHTSKIEILEKNDRLHRTF